MTRWLTRNSTYRMRQTSDDKPVLIPQYRYDGQLSFPHRNALIPPALAMPPRSPDGIVYSESSLGNRIGGSILKRPPSAVLRTPTSEEFDLSSIPQGDYTYDGRPRTSYTENYQFATPLSKSHNDMDSLIHPALRNLSEPVKTREVVSMGSVEVFGSGFRGSPFRPLASQDEISIIRDSAGQPQDVAFDNNLLQPPPQAKHTSRFIGQFPVRPKVFLRRSLTPHLYRPQDIAMTDPELQGESGVSYRQRQKTIGRLLLVCCILFPPLWFVMACGGFDSFVVTWTNGNVRGVGGVERKIALALAVVVAVGTVIGVVIGLTTASSVG